MFYDDEWSLTLANARIHLDLNRVKFLNCLFFPLLSHSSLLPHWVFKSTRNVLISCLRVWNRRVSLMNRLRTNERFSFTLHSRLLSGSIIGWKLQGKARERQSERKTQGFSTWLARFDSNWCPSSHEASLKRSNESKENRIMNETSNMNSNTTGGVCSSCLKEMPMVMSSANNPLSKLCSNCMTEFVDQQHLSSELNNKLPFLPSPQSYLTLQTQQQHPHPQQQQQQQQQQQMSSMFSSHFSSLPSSSASSTSSSMSSTRRFSGFDPFSSSGSNAEHSFLQPFTDFHTTFSPPTPTSLSNPHAASSTNASNEFMHYFHQFLHGASQHPASDRDSPASSVQSNDFSQSFFAPAQSSGTHGVYSPLSSSSMDFLASNRLPTNDLPSSFCCFENNTPYTYCLECETSLCEKCALMHPKILGFKNHRQQLLSSTFNPNGRTQSIIGQPIRSAQSTLPLDHLPSPPALNAGKIISALVRRRTLLEISLRLVRPPQAAAVEFSLARPSASGNPSTDFPSLFSSFFSQLSLNSSPHENPALLPHSPLSAASNPSISCHEHAGIKASYYCDICAHAYCHECQIHHAQQHTLSSLQDTIDNARQLTKQFLIESQTLLYHLDESLKQSTRTIENLSIKSSTIESEIRTMITYFLDILSQRQDFLLKNVDKIQTIKTQTLQRQINELNQVIKQLHLTILGK